MAKKEQVPAIRFQGFADPWEQRKVGELLTERNDQAPMSDEYPLMAFIANEGVAPKGERYDRSALVNDTTGKFYKKTEFGDFIYSSNNLETGSIGLNKYGKASISPVYSIFQPTGLADSDFIGRRFVRKDFINAMVKWRQGVIYGQWRIHESDFIRIEVAVPSVEEQRKIGAFLDQLDTLITLHQRKYDKLVAIKRSMLEKISKDPCWKKCSLGRVAVFQRFGLPDLLILGNSVSYPKCSPATLIRLIFHMKDMSDLVFAAMPKEHFTAMCQRVTNYRPHRCTEWLQTSSS